MILAHSMGGLVARYYLEVLGGWKDTRALITFGTPYRGAANALDFLANGFRRGFGPFTIDLSDTMRSFPSVHQLLPTYACIADPGGTQRKLSEVQGLPADRFDPGRVAAAAAFHDAIAKGVEHNGGYRRYQIVPVVGIFQPTHQTGVLEGTNLTIVDSYDGEDWEGDRTVPRFSATPLEMAAEQREVYATEVHGSLQNLEPVIAQITGVLTYRDLGGVRATPADGFRLTVDDLIAPGEDLVVTLATAGPALNAQLRVEDADTGAVVAQPTARLVDGEATFAVGGLAAGVYRLTGARGRRGRPRPGPGGATRGDRLPRRRQQPDRQGRPLGRQPGLGVGLARRQQAAHAGGAGRGDSGVGPPRDRPAGGGADHRDGGRRLPLAPGAVLGVRQPGHPGDQQAVEPLVGPGRRLQLADQPHDRPPRHRHARLDGGHVEGEAVPLGRRLQRPDGPPGPAAAQRPGSEPGGRWGSSAAGPIPPPGTSNGTGGSTWTGSSGPTPGPRSADRARRLWRPGSAPVQEAAGR